MLKGLSYTTAYVTAALPCSSCCQWCISYGILFYNLLRPNIIVKIRTGKVNAMEIFKIISFFWGVLAGLLACILWAALVSSLPATTKKVVVDLVMDWRKARRKPKRYSSVSAHGTVTEIQAAQLERDYSSALGQSLSLFDLEKVTEMILTASPAASNRGVHCRGQEWRWRKKFFLLLVTESGSPLCTRSLNGSKTTWEMYEGNIWVSGDKHNPSLWAALSCRELGAVGPAGATLPCNVWLIILFS